MRSGKLSDLTGAVTIHLAASVSAYPAPPVKFDSEFLPEVPPRRPLFWWGILYKPDFEPLLAAGRHEMTPTEFEARFVTAFEESSRHQIWQKFRDSILVKISHFDIPCEVWVDGSFVTSCPNPEDIDASIMILSEVIEILPDDALKYLKIFDDFDPALDAVLDVFLCPVYPAGHRLRGDQNDPDGWAKQWSSERNSGWLKGFVVIPFR